MNVKNVELNRPQKGYFSERCSKRAVCASYSTSARNCALHMPVSELRWALIWGSSMHFSKQVNLPVQNKYVLQFVNAFCAENSGESLFKDATQRNGWGQDSLILALSPTCTTLCASCVHSTVFVFASWALSSSYHLCAVEWLYICGSGLWSLLVTFLS